ncbi:hypothetical protein ACFV2B_30780 [Streptomyces lavendulae]|uniref:hypothetical protein n=1 Tax=Streptomyces lavendulae TaxID=1914 RepID=UPI0036A3A034
MTSRTIRVPLTAAGLLAAVALLLTGCGTAPAQRPKAAAPPGPEVFFAEVAARCAGAGSGAPASAPASSPASAEQELPSDPEARKYAENHGYRQQAGLSAEGSCRGDAHAARIRSALAGKAPGTAAELTGLLRGLGYQVGPGDVVDGAGGTGPGFALWLPGSGPCVEGRAGTPARVEAHGPYAEGGCREPAGGH